MKFLDRGMRQAAGVLALLWVVPASAQENLYGNKTPAQIFASDCAICHKSVQGLSKAGGPFGLGLDSFLREHYTASRESAAALAKYIQSVDTGPAAPEKNAKRSASKPAAKKPGDGKAAGGKPAGEPKGDAKPDAKTEVKTEAKPEPKAAEPKAEAKPESKPEAKPETKPAEPAKPEKSE